MHCPNCNFGLADRPDLAGQTFACPNCGGPFTVPAVAAIASSISCMVPPRRHRRGLWLTAIVVAIGIGVLVDAIPRFAKHMPTASDKAPVAFHFGTMRIGDLLTVKFQEEHMRQEDADQVVSTGYDTIHTDDGDVTMLYDFNEGKLSGAQLFFKSSAYPTLVRLYTEKFGCAPHARDTETVKNAMNAEFSNERVKWKTDSGDFHLIKYSGTISDGYGYLDNPYYRQRIAIDKQKSSEPLKQKL
jgi:hypothetical protein